MASPSVGAATPSPFDATPSTPLDLPARFGRYRLTKLLAYGGMAQIYLAKSFGAEGFVKPLVIKRLDPALLVNPYFTNLFVNEAKLLVTLSHGNVVPVFDFGRVGADLYIAMEYVSGTSLHELLQTLRKRRERLDPQLAAHVIAEVCKGLDYAHRKTDDRGQPAGIIHRDVKPTNILLSREGEVKIVDFGVAKLAGRADTSGRLTGTVSYMSPEQALRAPVDHRTDIFSTGLVLHEMLAGRRTYPGNDPREVLALARAADVPPVPEAAPEELRAIVARALRREPAARYASAHEMLQALEGFLLRARSAQGAGDAGPLGARVAGLLKEVGLEPERTASVLPEVREEEPPDDGGPEEVSGLVELPGPADLEVIRAAAETFHSEFLTRVLQEDPSGAITPARRRWLLPVALGGVLLLATSVGLVVRSLVRSAPDPVPTASRATAPRPVAVASASLRPRAAQPPDGAVAEVPAGRRPGRPSDAGVARAVVRPPRPPRAASAGFGYLSLNSVPWSEVTIDGRKLARPTPVLSLKLAAGTHTVELVNPERSLRRTLRLRIAKGKTLRRVISLR
ncbi:MAG: protein kinase [Deltaproteobacteria bacterium]|nr:protein kinase [Deltaproteobacteria bacterium]